MMIDVPAALADLEPSMIMKDSPPQHFSIKLTYSRATVSERGACWQEAKVHLSYDIESYERTNSYQGGLKLD
jgi:hypothetical protein